MAVTSASVRGRDSHGNQFVTVTDVTFDASYLTGGEPVTALQLGLAFVQDIIACNIVTTAAAGNAVDVAGLLVADGSVLLKVNAAAAEVPNATNLATLVVRVTAAGY